jgi:hypothetical protein
MATHIPGWDYGAPQAEELPVEIPDAGSRAAPPDRNRLPERIGVQVPPGRPEPPPPEPPDFAEVPQPGVA